MTMLRFQITRLRPPISDFIYFSSTLNSVLSGSRSGGSLFAVAGATGGSGSRLRNSESVDPKHQNIDH